jgi:adenylate cyclase
VSRRLAAIIAADVVGYSRLMERDEAGTLAALKAHREAFIEPLIAEHGGRVVKLMGDGALVEFPSIVDAVICATALQQGMAERNTDVPQDDRIEFRIGVNLGDVIIEGDDIYGDGVNVAARLETLAEPGGIALSGYAHDHVAGKLDLGFEDAGEHKLKNIARPIRVYRVAAKRRSVETSSPAAPPSAADKPSIAILPFTNMSGDPEQEYFSDGITEDIITELSRFHSLLVTARNSSFAFKDKSVDVKEIGRQLGVAHVLEGSVRRAGNRVRITAQLIDALTGNHVWAERYDRELRDVFDVQDEVTQAIVSIIAGRLGNPGAGGSKRRHPENMNAYELVLRGKEHFQFNTRQENLKARELFERAIELDPHYAQAYTWLGWTHFYDYELGWSRDSERSSRLGYSCAKRAVELDASDAWAQSGVSYSYMYNRQFDLGEVHIDRAIRLNPNDADILSLRGLFLSYLGRPEEGMESLEMALRRNPFGMDWYLWCLGIAQSTAAKHDKAVRAWREMSNTPTEVFACLAASYAHLGQMDAARRNLATFLERSRDELADFPGDDVAGWRSYWFKSFPYRDPENLEQLVDGLRKAGLPI